MTKEEIEKFLSGIKIYVKGKSEEIQKKLFSLGCSWFGEDKPRISYINKPIPVSEMVAMTPKMRIRLAE